MRLSRTLMLSTAALAGLVGITAATAATAAAGVTPAASSASAGWGGPKCFGVLPISGAKSYAQGCYGQDEPEIDPVSPVNGTGQDITWTIKLPTSSAKRSLLDLGPTFWIGTDLSDSSAVAQRAFSELQFYPDSSLLPQKGKNLNTACTSVGFNVQSDPGTWSVCDFTWGLYGKSPKQWQETAAYVKVLDLGTNPQKPMYLHSGDTVTVHIFDSGDANNDAEQVITDVTTGQSGKMIMDSDASTGAGSAANPGVGDGPLTLPYAANSTANPMPWGVVDGTPFAFSWEIGHPNFYSDPNQAICVPGQWDCYSYDTGASGWGAITPLQIVSATFGVGGNSIVPSSWATNDSEGGAAEVDQWCGAYDPKGSTNCSFPWYSYSPKSNSILFGTQYPGSTSQWQWGGSQAQYAQIPHCAGPLTKKYGFGYYCDTTLSPDPPIA